MQLSLMIGKLLRVLAWVIFVPTAYVIVSCQYRSHFYHEPVVSASADSDIAAQLRFLKSALINGAAENMQQLFPEGYFFNYVLYGLSWINVAVIEQKPAVTLQAVKEARWAYQKLQSESGRAAFEKAMHPPLGIFYTGWSNYLLGGIVLLQDPTRRQTEEVEAFRRASARIASAFRDTGETFLPSYPGAIWPCDSFAAMLSLQVHDHLLGPTYEKLRRQWLVDAKKYVEKKHGLLPHSLDVISDTPVQGPRATSQTMLLRFARELDPQWAQQQYEVFRRLFIAYPVALPGVREYPAGDKGRADIDSGPLIFGISLSSSTVAIGTAKMFGDREVVDGLSRAVEAYGMALRFGGKKRYMFGLLPVGDAFVLWSKTAVPWLERSPRQPPVYPNLFPAWLFWPYTLIGVMFIVAPVGFMINRPVRVHGQTLKRQTLKHSAAHSVTAAEGDDELSFKDVL